MFIDWEKKYDNDEFAELCEKMRDKAALYKDQIVLLVERDKSGRLVPRYTDEVCGEIAMVFFCQLCKWNENLPDENKVKLHRIRSSIGFNNERRAIDVGVSLVFPTAEQKVNSLRFPLRSPEFVTEVCRSSQRINTLKKIKESYLVNGTNTMVALLISWTLSGNHFSAEMEFYVRGRNEAVLGPMWKDWNSAVIPELDAIIPGFAFNRQLIMDTLHNYKRTC